MRRIVLVAFVAGCTARPFVASDDDAMGDDDTADDGTDSGGDDDRPGPEIEGDDDDDGIAEVDDGADDDDGGGSSESGEVLGCEDPVAPPVTVDVIPGELPMHAGSDILRQELDCEIQLRQVEGTQVLLGMDCEIEPLWFLTIVVTVDAPGITVPAVLDYPALVHARVTTYRDRAEIDEFPWLRTDHFALYMDDELVLAAGAGPWWPTTLENENDPAFYSPFELESVWTDCDGPSRECHDTTVYALGIQLGEEAATAHPFSTVAVGDYDVHVGEVIGSDSPQCGEPTYNWVSFAIAKAE
jgi:hypothetical protein